MKTLAAALVAILQIAFIALPAEAQDRDNHEDVTIRQLTAIPQANIDQLISLGSSATPGQIQDLVTNDWVGVPVRVLGVVLTDPHYSGLASVVDDIPNRIHYFIRDIAAETDGVEGMTIQVVDGTRTGWTLNLQPGDVVELEGELDIFGNGAQRVWQLNPDDDGIVIGEVDPALSWLQPVTVLTSDINVEVDQSGGEVLVQANWANFNDFNGQYVRVEGAEVTNSDQNDNFGRPRFAFRSFGEEERVVTYDISLRYRSKCGSGGASAPACHVIYPNPPFFSRPPDDPFIAPSPGAIIDIQGFLVFGPISDFFNLGQPPQALFYLSPITDDDLEINTTPPVIAIEPLMEVPTGSFDVYAVVQAAPGFSLESVILNYEFTSGASGSLDMGVASGDNRFVATIPAGAAEDGAFVGYAVIATDSDGQVGTSPTRRTRVLLDGITQIEHIQRTWNDGPGQGPFTGMTTEMQIEGVVMTDPNIPDIITIQDDADLNPWSGVYLIYTEALATQLQEGDIVQITEATIHDGPGAPGFNMTRLAVSVGNIAVVGSQSPYPYVEGYTTADFQSSSLAESYEGMAVRFDEVVVTARNADGDAPFGEFAFSSDGTVENQFRARTGTFDASSALPQGHTMFHEGHMIEYIQGIMAFTHGNYKLLPQTMDDFGNVTSSDTDGNAQQVTLDAAYPNPVSSRATITYALAQSGHVRVEVFDITGRRVAVLVDAEQAAGSQEVSLDANSMASGMYLIRLAAEGAVRTTRVIVAH